MQLRAAGLDPLRALALLGVELLLSRDERVLAFGAASLIYTSILSLWNSARSQPGQSPGAASAEVQVVRDDPTSPDVQGIVTPTRQGQGQFLNAARRAMSPLREAVAGSKRRDGEERS